MNADRFDRIAKTMATSCSRRRVLGGLLGGAGGLLGPERAGARHRGCRHTGDDCTRAGQCCTGRCAGNDTCQHCSRAGQCPSPPASKPCQKRACTSAGTCVIRNKAEGATCTTCQASTCSCQDGACEACLARKANCTSAAACCQDGGEVACAPIGNLDQGQCCRPLGGACSTPGAFDECCAFVFAPGSGSLVYCGPNNTCGGTGANCQSAFTCASGVCCGNATSGACCGIGQQCVGSQCVD